MYARAFFASLLIVYLCSEGIVRAQSLPGTLSKPSTANEAAVAKDFSSPFNGEWTYRSFRSDPDLNTPVEDLLFGAGTLSLATPSMDKLEGTLGGEGWQLVIKGSAAHGNPATIRFQGKGIIGGEEWVYDYVGYLVPVWPNGIEQRPAIVGSIVRTAPHSNGQATTGYVAQWIAIRKDVEINQEPNAIPATSWRTTDSNSSMFDASELKGKPAVLVFTKGFSCLHCSEQVNVFSNAAEAFKKRGVQVVFLVSETANAIAESLGKSQLGDFKFAADPDREAFRFYNCGSKNDSHGLVVLDSDGRVCQRISGDLPLTDVGKILAMIDSQSR